MQGFASNAPPTHLNIFTTYCDIEIMAEHIPRVNDTTADELSRNVFPFESTGTPPTNTSSTTITSHADTTMGGLHFSKLLITVQQYFS